MLLLCAILAAFAADVSPRPGAPQTDGPLPAGATARAGSSYLPSGAPLIAVTVASDGTVYTQDFYGQLTAWHAGSGQPSRVLRDRGGALAPEPAGSGRGVVALPQGDLLVVEGSQLLRLDPRTGQARSSTRTPYRLLQASPGGEHVVGSGIERRTGWVHGGGPSSVVAPFDDDMGTIDVAVHPDGLELAFVQSRTLVRTEPSGREITRHELPTFGSTPTYSADGSQVWVDGHGVLIVVPSSGGPVTTIDLPSDDRAKALVPSPDGSRLAVLRSRAVLVVEGSEVVAQRAIRTHSGAEAQGVAWSPDGETLYAASERGTPWRWRWRDDTLLPPPIVRHNGDIVTCDLSVDGRIAASWAQGSGAEILVWDATTGAPRHRLQHPAWPSADPQIHQLHFEADGQRLWALGQEVLTWDLSDGSHRRYVLHDGRDDTTPSLDTAVFVGGDVWAARRGTLLRLDRDGTVTKVADDGQGEAVLAGAPDGTRLAIWDERGLRVRSLGPDGRVQQVSDVPRSGSPPFLAWAEVGLVFGGSGQPFRVWDGAAVHERVAADYERRGLAVVGEVLWTGFGPAVERWRISDGKALGKRTGHSGRVLCGGSAAGGERAVTGASDTTLLVWER